MRSLLLAVALVTVICVVVWLARPLRNGAAEDGYNKPTPEMRDPGFWMSKTDEELRAMGYDPEKVRRVFYDAEERWHAEDASTLPASTSNPSPGR